MTAPVPVPAAAVEQLLPYVQRLREADAALSAAVALVLAALGAPPGAQIEVRPDGGMFVLEPEQAKPDDAAERAEAASTGL